MHPNMSSFQHLKFTKPGSHIVTKATKVRDDLRAKVALRRTRIETIAAENKVDMADLIGHLDDFESYTNSVGLKLTAGDMASMKAEARLITQEKGWADHLDLMIRNLDQGASHELDFEDLAFLEF